jgi:hypothetical protein
MVEEFQRDIINYNLKLDPDRADEHETGIFVRAQDQSGGWHSADIAHLDKASLLAWLRSRGGNNPMAEDTVGILLGHGHIVNR